GGPQIAAFAPVGDDIPPAIGRHDSWNHGNSPVRCVTERMREGVCLIVVVVPPAARPRAPLAKTGLSGRDCASSPLSSRRPSRPRASSRKAQDYGDRPATCQRALTRFGGRRLSGAVAADFGAVFRAEAQKTERRDQRD